MSKCKERPADMTVAEHMDLDRLTPHPCICCGAKDWRSLYRHLVRCPACGYVRAARIDYTPEELDAFYTGSYFTGEGFRDYAEEEANYRAIFRRRLEYITSLVPGGRMFEIGCAYGFWLDTAREVFAVSGMDISADAVGEARRRFGLDVQSGDFLQADLPDESFEVICLWDTFEHVPHPEDLLAAIVRRLKPGGWLFMTVPDFGSLAARVQGRNWSSIHPPTHLHYFSRKTMERLLRRYPFEPIRFHADTVYLTLAWVLHQRSTESASRLIRKVAGAVRRIIPQRLQEKAGGWVTLGDVIFVSARKTKTE
jgi:SAM-dependent methyltransferase